MRILTPLIALALILVVGCAKDDLTPKTLNPGSQNLNETGTFMYDVETDGYVWTMITADEYQGQHEFSTKLSTRDNNGNSVHTHGSFPAGEFSGTTNNGGSHGSATLNLGPSQFELITECVMGEGNTAVYGGIITALTNSPPFLGLGDHVYFKVIDNGQGADAPADQFNGAIFFTGTSSKCDIWVSSHPIWSLAPDIDVPEPGSIKVNN